MSLLHVALFKVDIHQLLEPYTKRLGGTKKHTTYLLNTCCYIWVGWYIKQ